MTPPINMTNQELSSRIKKLRDEANVLEALLEKRNEPEHVMYGFHIGGGEYRLFETIDDAVQACIQFHSGDWDARHYVSMCYI